MYSYYTGVTRLSVKIQDSLEIIPGVEDPELPAGLPISWLPEEGPHGTSWGGLGPPPPPPPGEGPGNPGPGNPPGVPGPPGGVL